MRSERRSSHPTPSARVLACAPRLRHLVSKRFDRVRHEPQPFPDPFRVIHKGAEDQRPPASHENEIVRNIADPPAAHRCQGHHQRRSRFYRQRRRHRGHGSGVRSSDRIAVPGGIGRSVGLEHSTFRVRVRETPDDNFCDAN